MESEGKVIDWYFADKTEAEGFPYPCATEREYYDTVSNGHSIFHGATREVLTILIYLYNGFLEENNESNCSIYKDLSKVAYWKKYLLDNAAAGNRECQAALTSDFGLGGHKIGWLPESEWEELKSKYKQALITDAAAGDPQACYAVALYEMDDAKRGTPKRHQYFTHAAEDGMGDAYYQLAIEILDDNDFKVEYESEENKQIYHFFLLSAQANNGAYAGYTQELIGKVYKDGEIGFPRDETKAKDYFEMAAKNGNKQ